MDTEIDVRVSQAEEDPYLRMAVTVLAYVPVILGRMAVDGFLDVEAMEAQVNAIQKQGPNA